ncbi:MAG: hypothetical protein HYW48_05980 [Deltaproteobacteria bacterium]|nr:hypothetical protein [Deltaproteobacteria bacterium]
MFRHVAAVLLLIGSVEVEEERSLRAIFNLRYFTGNGDLLQAGNINFSLEYYLLENLGAGLVYENWYSPDNWDPLLAEDWKQVDNTKWLFHLRRSLNWSDGSPMLLSELKAHFERLRDHGSRHISILKNLKDIDTDDARHTLLFIFKDPVNDSFIHELALADAVVLHPRNLKGDWSVTSGPYYIASQSREKLLLKANPSFVNARPIIKTIEILPPKAVEREGTFDVMKRPAYSFHSHVQNLEKRAGKVWSGYPVTIYYFRFRREHELFARQRVRQAFAQLVAEAFQDVQIPHSIVYDDQMIPNGFKGRLKDWHPREKGDLSALRSEIKSLKKQALTIRWQEKASPLLSEKLKLAAQKHGIQISLCLDEEEGIFAEFVNIIGNQRDPLGTWNFLYGEGGPVHDFYPDVERLFADIARNPRESEREALLHDLHRQALEHSHLVPFMAEHNAILASKAVDLSRTNPFDQRLRFFEMKWAD